MESENVETENDGNSLQSDTVQTIPFKFMEEKPALTIIQAVIEALKSLNRPLTVNEIHDFIVAHRLYQFGTEESVSAVRSAVISHCDNLSSSHDPSEICLTSSSTGDGRRVYSLLQYDTAVPEDLDDRQEIEDGAVPSDDGNKVVRYDWREH